MTLLKLLFFIMDGVLLPLAAVVITYSAGHNRAALRKARCLYTVLYKGASGARSTSGAWRADWAVL